MHFLPPEIWMQIFSLACVDDGSTGLALSSVSRQLRALSASFRYQSLSIRRSKQIITWSRLIHSYAPASKATKYLYIRCPDTGTSFDISDEEEDEDYYGSPMNVSSDLVSDSNSSSKDSDYEGELDREERIGLQEEVKALQTHDSDEHFEMELSRTTDPMEADNGPLTPDSDSLSSFERKRQRIDDTTLHALRCILHELSRTLIIVSIHWSSFEPFLIEEIFPVLPQLKELYIHRVFTSQDALEPESEPLPPLLFPQLRYLHISGYLDQRPISFGQYLQATCPELHSLRVPKGIVPPDQSDKDDLPKSLHNVILQVASWSMKESVVELWKSFFGEEWLTTKSVCVVCEPYASSPEQWKAWWADRVSGGPGPWALGAGL